MKKYLMLSILTLSTFAFADNQMNGSNPTQNQPQQAPAPVESYNDQEDVDEGGENEDEDVIIMEEDDSEVDGNSSANGNQ